MESQGNFTPIERGRISISIEGDSIIAAMLNHLSIGRGMTRHGDEEVDTISGLSTVGLP